MQNLTIILAAVFFVLFIFGLNKKSTHVSAKNGSVAIGGNNHGDISVKNSGETKTRIIFWDVWNTITGFVTLVSFVMSIWLNK